MKLNLFSYLLPREPTNWLQKEILVVLTSLKTKIICRLIQLIFEVVHRKIILKMIIDNFGKRYEKGYSLFLISANVKIVL